MPLESDGALERRANTKNMHSLAVYFYGFSEKLRAGIGLTREPEQGRSSAPLHGGQINRSSSNFMGVILNAPNQIRVAFFVKDGCI